MSATPLNNHIDVEIEAQKVVDEGMIKEDVIVNQGINKEDKTLAEQDSELLVLQKVMIKDKKLLKNITN